jgi:hypothetical protein
VWHASKTNRPCIVTAKELISDSNAYSTNVMVLSDVLELWFGLDAQLLSR